MLLSDVGTQTLIEILTKTVPKTPRPGTATPATCSCSGTGLARCCPPMTRHCAREPQLFPDWYIASTARPRSMPSKAPLAQTFDRIVAENLSAQCVRAPRFHDAQPDGAS